MMESSCSKASEFQNQGLQDDILKELKVALLYTVGSKFMEFLALVVTEAKNINQVENFWIPFLVEASLCISKGLLFGGNITGCVSLKS